MTANVLFVVGELETVTISAGTPIFDTTSGHYDTNFSFGDILAGTADRFQVSDLASATAIYCGVSLYVSSATITANAVPFAIKDHTGQVVVRLIAQNTTDWQLQRWNGAGFTNIGVTFTVTTGAILRLDIGALVDGSAGEVVGYINGNLTWQFTGNTAALTDLDSIEFGGLTATKTCGWSEGVIADAITVGYRLATVHPNATGATSNWTGGYTDVDEVGTPNDADFIYTTSANQVSTFGLEGLSATALTYNVTAVVVAARAKRNAAGPQNLQATLHISGSDYFGSNYSGITTSFSNEHEYVWSLNPNTSAPWSASDIASLEAGVKSIT